MKKIISVVLAIIISASMCVVFPLSTYAQKEETSYRFVKYNVQTNNEEIISFNMYKHGGYFRFMSEEPLYLYYSIDTIAGQSGAPIYDSGQIVWGIHILGFNPNDTIKMNKGRKIDSVLFQILRAAKQEGIEKWNS